VCLMLLFRHVYIYAEDKVPSASDLIIVNGKTIDPASLKTVSYFQKGSLRSEIESEARRLAEAGFFDKAISRYRDALHPVLIEDEVNKSMALWGIMQIHQWQGKFDSALQELQWFLKMRADKSEYTDKKAELEALIKARDTSSNQSIYEFIDYMKKKWEKLIPPQASNTYTSTVTSPIIQLYDYMGDYKGGISFVEPIIKYHESNHHQKLSEEYTKIKQAFEESIRTGTKGLATHAILISDDFSW